MADEMVSSGQVWKCGDGQWLSVDEVRGNHVTGRLRIVPPATTSKWTGSRAAFENYELAHRWKVGATCEGWDDGAGKRALGEHWVHYDSAGTGREIRESRLPPQTSPAGVQVSVYAVTREEAKALVEAALAAAHAGCTDCQVRG